ncbi:MAG: zinc ribbon domain-containing protein [Bryobacterales bacterium]|nr:zinc ribbon domain-containing protein [Bryobacteraceae bacterium]MDW8129804.1 zinc ribbon domain-containing protein [Bryobacterales bacterium]
MPLYEYRCKQCGEPFEQLRRLGEADRDVTCPRCGAEEVERLLSVFSQSVRGCGGSARRGFT